MGSRSERRVGRGKPIRVLLSSLSRHQECLRSAQNEEEKAWMLLYTLVACTCLGADWTAKASNETSRQESRDLHSSEEFIVSESLSFYPTVQHNCS